MRHTIFFNWFKMPTQVSFYDINEDRWINGIGYRDEIICAECGEIIPLKHFYEIETLEIEPNPVMLLGDWVDFSDYIEDDFDEEDDFYI